MAIWILLLALTTFAGGLGTGWPLLQQVAYALWLVVASAFAVAFSARRGLSASLSVESLHLTAGESLEETVTVRKRGLLPALWVTIVDPLHGRRSFLGLRSGEELEWRRARVFAYRGRYTIGGDEIRTQDPFGLFSFLTCRLDPIEVTVYPRPIPIEETSVLQGIMRRRSRPWSEAADASIGDLRQYVAGDPPGRIHWRSTARTGTLIVADPEPRSRQSIWLAVDLGGGEEAADRAAGIAAHLCSLLASSGLRVGAVVAGDEVVTISPRPGSTAESSILEALGRTEASDTSELALVVRAFNRIQTPDALIVVSPYGANSTELTRLRRMAGSLAFISSAQGSRQ